MLGQKIHMVLSILPASAAARKGWAGSTTWENFTGQVAFSIWANLRAIGSASPTIFRSSMPPDFSTANVRRNQRKLQKLSPAAGVVATALRAVGRATGAWLQVNS